MSNLLMERVQIDAAEVQSRLDFFQITGEDLERIRQHRAVVEEHTDGIIEQFYELLLTHPSTRVYLGDSEQVLRLKRMQREYFLSLWDGRIDASYVENRLRVGTAHERHGLPPKWYLGAYSLYLRLIHSVLRRELAPEQAQKACDSIQKVIMFDVALALDTYIAAQMETLGRHRAAIRELSTPVIKVHDGVLLLPLVGTIDSHRAQQVMETSLVEVAKHQARVLIVDIAGVAVVDTQVADYLLRATAAVRLLGTRTILSGISPAVARTIVELGVDISTIETCNRLADAIQRALKLIGRRIVAEESR